MIYDIEELYRIVNDSEPGEPKMRALRIACSEAENNNDIINAVRFHYKLMYESVFSGDRYQALIDFPQYLALLEKDEMIKDQYFSRTMLVFRWILEAANEFYQISKQQILKWFGAYQDECLTHGCSLRSYWQKKAIFDSRISRAKLKLDYINSLECPEDDYTDGDLFALDDIVMWELEFGNYEKAMKAAREIFRSKRREIEIPAKTYMNLLKYYMKTEDNENADRTAALLKPFCIGERFQLEPTGIMFEYYSKRNIKEGIEFYNRQAVLREGLKNPYLCFWFDRGTAMLFYEAGKTENDEYIKIADAAAEKCMQTAHKFDERNESSWFMDKCCF
ncbi:MAG: hypothetical protein Q4F95_15540 [Oscillospiraceae bacterium]|nr:hypothetical protein [Oscillospiraceae bacterium]